MNTTPDSFSDGGRYLSSPAALEQAQALVAQGADLIDVGGESTRPGSDPVPEIEELRRVIPAISAIAEGTTALISVDTTKANVAREALQAGAHIVNDISGLTFDPRMPDVCAEFHAGVVCMHIQGIPQTMQLSPSYQDVVTEVSDFLAGRLSHLEQLGIARECVVIDPGIGFGKTANHNLEILRSIARFRSLGRPVCIGHSRKRFLEKLLGRPIDERVFATVGVSVGVALQGAEIIRVHDVAASRDAILACRAVYSGEETREGSRGF